MLTQDPWISVHFCALVMLTGALTSEYFLFRRGMSIEQVRKLLIADGLAALALLLLFLSGMMQLYDSPQGPAALLQLPSYRLKLLLFLLMALSFGYPSRLFYRWRRSLRRGRPPMVSTQQQLWVIWILRIDLLLLMLIPLLAHTSLP
ncbi:DUF2214 family protein [Aeromonas bivalvium]|uniref:DUF2214 family protein n=1 Tax=Aeromonas bivalvium TaxID=440079 RepID=UPI0038D22722